MMLQNEAPTKTSWLGAAIGFTKHSSFSISANNCCDNYSFLEAQGLTTIHRRKAFKGGKY